MSTLRSLWKSCSALFWWEDDKVSVFVTFSGSGHIYGKLWLTTSRLIDVMWVSWVCYSWRTVRCISLLYGLTHGVLLLVVDVKYRWQLLKFLLVPVFVCNTLCVFVCVSGVKMRKFAYCKVVLATSLVWVMLDMFILLYFSECNKCDDKKERGLPGRDREYTHTHSFVV